MRKGYLTPPVLIVLALITLFVASAIFFNTYLLKSLKKEPTPSPTPSTQPSPKSKTNETANPDLIGANWQTYTSENLGISFKYPIDYSNPKEIEGYLSIISPLNLNRDPKMSELQNGELKIEVYLSETSIGESLEQFAGRKEKDLGEVIDTAEITVGGVKAIVKKWHNQGDGETIYILSRNKEYIVQKFPLATTRQKEFNQILSTFKFLD